MLLELYKDLLPLTLDVPFSYHGDLSSWTCLLSLKCLLFSTNVHHLVEGWRSSLCWCINWNHFSNFMGLLNNENKWTFVHFFSFTSSSLQIMNVKWHCQSQKEWRMICQAVWHRDYLEHYHLFKMWTALQMQNEMTFVWSAVDAHVYRQYAKLHMCDQKHWKGRVPMMCTKALFPVVGPPRN